MHVRRPIALALLLLGALCAPLARGATERQPILPKTFGGWTLVSPHETSGAALAPALGDNFAVLVESGLVSTEIARYQRSGAPRMDVKLYRFRDSAGAYAAYTFLRTPDMSPSDLTEKCAVSRDRILAAVGSLLLDLSAPGAASLSDLKALVTLLQEQTPRGVYPTLWQYLPGQGFERTSDHFLLGPAALSREFPFASGDWLGFSRGVEAESARYHLGADSLTLLLAVYPTPQLARQELDELEAHFGVRHPAQANDAAAQSHQPPSGTPLVFAERRGLMITMVAGAHDARSARALLDRIDYETAVTWNEPSWEAKEPPFLVMLVNILITTCLLVVYTFLAGLVFAGARLLVKRFAPGKVFDREKDMEVLQLGLSSKPIKAKDFLSVGSPQDTSHSPSSGRLPGDD